MTENKNIENKIKESFEGMNRSAPDGLWGNLSDKLDVSDADRNIDERVKEGFDSLDETAPEHVWEGVNRQLNIDRVWNRISSALDRRAMLYWRRMAGVAALLLLLLGWGGYSYLLDSQKPVIAELNDNNIDNTTNSQSAVGSQQSAVGSHQTTKPSIKHPAPITNQSINQSPVDRSPITDHRSPITDHQSPITNHQTPSTHLASSETIAQPTKLIPIRPVLVLAGNDANKELFIISLNDYYSDALVEKKSHFEIGLIYSYNNTWILNNETRKSFDEKSLVQTVPTYASSYGLVANYNFSGKSALSAEFYINAGVKQNYSVYIEGIYYDKEIELNYSKITLLYQRNIQQYRKRIPSKYTIKAGGYLAYLKNNIRYHNDDIVSINDDYTDLDYGIKLAIGQEKDIRKFILGYGVNSEYGLKNIFRGNERMNADFDNTKIARIGAYLIIKYKL